MATAVIDIDLANVPVKLAVHPRCDQSLILIRWRGRPLGKITLPVLKGDVQCDDLRQTLCEAAGSTLRKRLLEEFLEVDTTDEMDVVWPCGTVAVCTRDRPDDLRRCLDALVRMPDDGQEILVIDNCPATDATARLVSGYVRVRYVREDKPGLNTARNRAMREARNPIVAFTDDDAVPDIDWLRNHLRHFNDPMVMCSTGLTMPLELETEPQEWHEKYSPFGRGFEIKIFDSARISPMASGQVGAGVNMALRREAMDLLGPFDEALDAGTPTRSGGDHEMFARVLSAGYKIVYDPAALSWHRHRTTWRELRRAAFGYGVGVYAFWTSSVLRDREFGAAWVAWAWGKKQIRRLIRSVLGRPGSLPVALVALVIAGCMWGPYAYVSSRRKQRRWKSGR